jgi:hypothetical protein
MGAADRGQYRQAAGVVAAQHHAPLSSKCYLPAWQFFALQAFKKHARGPPFLLHVPTGQ